MIYNLRCGYNSESTHDGKLYHSVLILPSSFFYTKKDAMCLTLYATTRFLNIIWLLIARRHIKAYMFCIKHCFGLITISRISIIGYLLCFYNATDLKCMSCISP